MKEANTDLLQQQKWMPAHPVPTQSSLLNLGREKLFKEKKDKNFQSYT